jgi:hypothetical protein
MEIQATAVDTQKCKGAIRWIRLIAEDGADDDGSSPFATSENQPRTAPFARRRHTTGTLGARPEGRCGHIFIC